MPSVKRRFENDSLLRANISSFVKEYLQKDGLAEAKAFNATNLTCSIAALMAAKDATFLGLSVHHSGSSVVIRMVSDGATYNPLDDLDIRSLIDSDPPLPDEDFDAPQPKEQLLKALRNSLSYYRRNNHNEVEYVVRKSQPRTLEMVLVAFGLAIVVGLLLRFFAGDEVNTAISTYLITPLWTMFLNALKMLVVPVVFFSIAASVANVSDIREYGRIGIKVFSFYTFTSFLAVLVGFFIYQVVQPGTGVLLDLSKYSYTADSSKSISILETIENIVPSSFVGAFTSTEMLQIIFLAILTGVAAGLLDNGEDRQKVSQALGLLNRLMLKLASIVMLTIPVATFCAMTLLILAIDTSMIVALIKMIMGMLLGVACMFTIYCILFFLFIRKNPGTFLRKCVPNFISFITFCSTSAVMPQSLDTCTKGLGISPKISSFSMPLGSTINMDGACIYLTISALFLAEIYHVPLTLGVMLRLAVTIVILSMGAPPIAGAGFICLSILVLQMGVPIDSLGILMGIDRIMSMCRTLVNGTGDFVGTAVVANSEKLMDFQVFDAKPAKTRRRSR